MILTGAPGSGKSAVVDALSTALEVERVPFGAIECEQLARGFPWLSPAGWLPQLAAVIALQSQAGRETFLIVVTAEDEQQLRAVIEAVAAERRLVGCLTAPADVVATRVATKEPDSWPGKQPLIDHACHLAGTIPMIPGIDLVISTVDRSAEDVAGELRNELSTRGVLPKPA